MRNYEYHTLEEEKQPSIYRFNYERTLRSDTDSRLLANFNKVADWIKENCPNLSGVFACAHNPFHWVKLVVENGKAYLEEGSHGWGYDIALSKDETAVFSRGSMQSAPYAFEGVQFFKNERLDF